MRSTKCWSRRNWAAAIGRRGTIALLHRSGTTHRCQEGHRCRDATAAQATFKANLDSVCDAYLVSEWVGVFDDTPPPPLPDFD